MEEAKPVILHGVQARIHKPPKRPHYWAF